jgi:hypothetical protein
MAILVVSQGSLVSDQAPFICVLHQRTTSFLVETRLPRWLTQPRASKDEPFHFDSCVRIDV